MNPFTFSSSETGELVLRINKQKQKAPAFIDRNARALEMSCVSSWRLYPERSITSHSICGSGRLFPGFKRAKRRVESDMAELLVASDTSPTRESIPFHYSNVNRIMHFGQLFQVNLQTG